VITFTSRIIGELEHKFPQSFIVKYSDKADSSSPLQDTEDKIKLKKNEGETTFEADK